MKSRNNNEIQSDLCEDGLLLLILPAYPDPDYYEILNPITGLREKLPETTPGHGWGSATPESSILATSSSTGVYKVVHTANTPDDKFFLEIITVGGGGGGGWRDISGPCAGFCDVSWVRNDGFLHAISRRGFQTHLHSHMYMLSLDVDKETFHEMRLPPCCEKENYHFLDSRGRRALLADQLSMIEFDIWTSMDDKGIEWTKVYSFNADRCFGGLWNVVSVSAVLGSDDLKRLVLHVEVVEGDGGDGGCLVFVSDVWVP
ncbi:hypothetical protein QJS10_CPB13g00176 [Acorus calamus]|uniref:F-box associated domain-containing protein n=1 Tax=Acorus calamus TaxID=4465 RepID=A0AAV9DG78_ACOCL|nr:hypothetical protein QJS10_CPB13g00176 [Acorus calamus]